MALSEYPTMSETVFVLNGPNLNLLGEREPHIYGRQTLHDIELECRQVANELGLALAFRQTNAEHELIEWLHEARRGCAGIVINPAGFTQHSVPVFDALMMCECPIVEVHISNLHRRAERWRAESIMTAAATGVIAGLGAHGYVLAIRHVARLAG